MALRCLGGLVLGMLVAGILLIVLMRSADRGQILFALVASFALGVLASQQVLPGPGSLVAWLIPMLVAILFYAFAWASIGRAGSDWTDVPFYARALPIDWLTAGGGGALLGYWISARVHEMRHAERAAQGGA